MESTVLLEEPETLDAELLQEEEVEAKAEAEKTWPALTMFTDGQRLEDGAAGYSVEWKNGQSWVVVKTHTGYNQEAYDAECAAVARVLETASRRDGSRMDHDLYRCLGRRQTDGLRRIWPWPDVRAPGKKAHRSTAEGQAGHHH